MTSTMLRGLVVPSLAMLMACAGASEPLGTDGSDGAVGTTTQALAGDALHDGTWGGNNEGADIALTNIDADPRPDLIFLRVDAPSGGNTVNYRVGYNVDATTHEPTSYGPPMGVPGTIGDHTSGAGVTTGDINGNGVPDLLFVYVDNPSGQDAIWYRIGWDLSANGTVSSWAPARRYLGGFSGDNTAGAGCALRDLDGNGVLDLVVGTVDDPSGENKITLSVGWNLNTAGYNDALHIFFSSIPIIRGGTVFEKRGWVGSRTADMGLSLADTDGNGKLDVIVSWVDAPSPGQDQNYAQVGYDVAPSGSVIAWGPPRKHPTAAGETTDGSGNVVYDFDGDGKADVMSFFLDHGAAGDDANIAVAFDLFDARRQRVRVHGKCLTAPSSGSNVSWVGCWNTGEAYQWIVATNDWGNLNLIHKATGKCAGMDADNGDDFGATLTLQDCGYTTATQSFSLITVQDPNYPLTDYTLLKLHNYDVCVYDQYDSSGRFTQAGCNSNINVQAHERVAFLAP